MRNNKYTVDTTKYSIRLEDSKINFLKSIYKEESITALIEKIIDEAIEKNISKPPKITSPIIRIGGKSAISNNIVELMPKHKFYVDVFGGAGHVLLAKPQSLSKAEVFNDKSDELITFFRMVQKNPLLLRDRLLELPCSRRVYMDFLHSEVPKDDMDKAVRFFYIVRNSYYGDGRSGWRASTKNNIVKTYQRIINEFYWVSDRFKDAIIDNNDWKTIVNRYDRPSNLLYVDPPYIVKGKQKGIYEIGFGMDEHIKLANRLNAAKAMVMVSHYDCEEYNNFYKGWNVHHIETYKASGKIVDGKKPRVIENVYCNF